MAPTSSFSSAFLLFLLLATVAKEIASQPTKPDVDGPEWNYDPTSPHGPDHWSEGYSMCGGQSQSPIDIPVVEAILNSSLTDFNYVDYSNALPSHFELENTGTCIDLSGDWKSAISGGGLTATYKLYQLHFHWGTDNKQGSEHLLNGKASPLEIHLVHWNNDYESIEESLKYTDGLAVLGILVKVSNSNESSALGNLTSYFDEILHPGNVTTVPSFDLKSLLPECKTYYRYQGSLTTPACQESVIWTVFRDPIYLNEKEIDAFRSIYSTTGEKLLYNFRPPQPLNGRVVYTSPSETVVGGPVPVREPSVAGPQNGPKWNYNLTSPQGPDSWDESYPMCGGQSQSPIDIPVVEAIFNSSLTDFSYIDYSNALPSHFKLRNIGYTIQFSGDWKSTISGGGLTATYKLDQFHFHWGTDNKQGSEHLLDGKASPLEIHIVHWNKNYKSREDALKYADGLAVLAVFVQVSNSSESSAIGNLTAYFDEILHPGNVTTVPSFDLKSLLPENKTYYRYHGSWSRPACDESLIWTVFHDPIYLNEKEIAAFRSSFYDSAGERLLVNFRPPQPLNGRVVYTSNPASATPHQPTTSATVLATLSVVMAIVFNS